MRSPVICSQPFPASALAASALALRTLSPRTIAVTMLALLTFASAAAAKVRVVTTLPDLAALARDVGGDLVEVEALSRPGEDPHRFTATPSMVVRISRADLFVVNGLELEVGWAPALLQSARNAQVRPGGRGYVDASHRLDPLDVPTGAVDRSMGDLHAGGNPHYTLDPVACKRAAWNICNGLMRVDPDHADIYVARLRDFYARADAAAMRARERLRPFGALQAIVYHKFYTYLLHRLGIRPAGSIEPLPGVPPSAAHLARLIAAKTTAGVRLVIIEPWNDRRVADRVAREIGARVVVPFPSVGGTAATDDVIALFEKNVARIVAALAES